MVPGRCPVRGPAGPYMGRILGSWWEGARSLACCDPDGPQEHWQEEEAVATLWIDFRPWSQSKDIQMVS